MPPLHARHVATPIRNSVARLLQRGPMDHNGADVIPSLDRARTMVAYKARDTSECTVNKHDLVIIDDRLQAPHGFLNVLVPLHNESGLLPASLPLVYEEGHRGMVLADFTAEAGSPHEVSVAQGEIVTMLGAGPGQAELSLHGWSFVFCEGRVGWVPETYLDVLVALRPVITIAACA